jgi:hypothetical protein
MQVPNSKFGQLVCDQKMQTVKSTAGTTSAYPGLLPRVFAAGTSYGFLWMLRSGKQSISRF